MLLIILEFIKKHYKGFAAGALVLFLCLHVKSCEDEKIAAKNSPLPPNVTEKITVKNNTVTIQTPTTIKTISGVREGTLTIMKDGNTKLDLKDHGFVLNPIIGFGANGTGMKGIVGAELYYYKKLDLIGGVAADQDLSHAGAFVALGYCPENKFFHNSTFWIGPMMDVSGSKGIAAGVAVRI
jgi:hypothetical protein